MGQAHDNSHLSSAEQRILRKAAKGRIASFDRDDDPDDPADLVDWTDREVSAAFVRKLAKGKKKWPVAAEGIRISGVRVVGRLDLSDTELAHPLGFQRSMIAEPVSLEGARTRSLAFVRSRVGPIAAGGMHCDGSLELAQSALGAVDLSGAVITGDLTTDDALLAGGLDTEGATIEGDTYPPEARNGIHPEGWRGLSNGAATPTQPDSTTDDSDDAASANGAAASTTEEAAVVASGSEAAQGGRPLSERIGSAEPASATEPEAEAATTTVDEPVADAPSALPELPSPGELPPGAVEVAAGQRTRRLTAPRLLLLWVVAIAAAAVLVFLAPDDAFRADVNGQDTTEPCGGEIECFDEVAYATDVLVPFIDLDQENSWHPDGSDDWGRPYQVGRWVGIGLGWLFTVGLAIRLVEAVRRRS